jgi:hypothetical protein
MREVHPGYRIVFSIEELDEHSNDGVSTKIVYDYKSDIAAKRFADLSNAMDKVVNIKGWDKEYLVLELERRSKILVEFSNMKFNDKKEVLEKLSEKLHGELSERQIEQ